MLKMFAVVYRNGGIGMKKSTPFQYKGMNEIKDYFDKYTIGRGNNAIIMGKNTERQFPILPKRQTLVLSNKTSGKVLSDKKIFKNLSEAKKKGETYDEMWIIGGEKTFNSCIYDCNLKTIHIVEINKDIMSDCFFPEIPISFKLSSDAICKNENFTYRKKIYMKGV